MKIGNIGASGTREGESGPARAAFGATLRHGDENELFKDRAALNLGYEERRGAQTIGEAALRAVHGLATLPRHNTSELKIAVIADLPAADLAGGHVVQPADAEVDFQAVGERVREASAATVECLPKALQFGEGGGHATACFGWRF